MSSNHTEVMVPIHGGLFHSTCIFICKFICSKRGYTLKNPEAFSRLAKSPGIPDVYLSYSYKSKDGYGQLRTLEQSVCIEIETNATSTSILKKSEQFTRPGMRDPIIIDMGKKYEDYKKKRLEKGLSQLNEIDLIAEYIDHELVL
jgi:hypothetical protein